jgi:hypothetical protein
LEQGAARSKLLEAIGHMVAASQATCILPIVFFLN